MHFVTYIHEASGLVKTFHMNSKEKAVELLKGQVCWIQRQSRCMIKKILLDSGKQYAERSKDLELQCIEAHSNASVLRIRLGR